ncbi:MFS transporter [Oceanobacter mangrovi]|uniref:MFS transporter n=1 Tax=Oceanobacter mangrovi TaxID=2862510 RepID=UPI001C8DFD63|nr:MFS transporter [Oceanobacter mangrovi]
MSAASTAASPGTPPPAGPVFGVRLALGLFGVLLAAMVSGLSNRVPGLLQADIQGHMGISSDAYSWLSSIYSAGEMAVMPFASWMAITFSLRRFHLSMLFSTLLLALLVPLVDNLTVLMVMRLVQGITAGALIPLLMMSALRFLPPPIRLHGLALYAMTATLAPNVALWLASWSVDVMADWRFAYWQIIPLGLLAAGLVWYGIPKMPLALGRISQGNWLGVSLGVPGLVLFGLGLGQAVRLDWLVSPVIQALMLSGGGLVVLFMVTEWFHPTPFMKLQMLGRRNLGIGFIIFFILLIVLSSGVAIPVMALQSIQGFRMEQLYTIGLVIGLPQLVLGSVVAILLYQQWTDARYMLILGLVCIALACFDSAQITPDWMVQQFYLPMVLQLIGQPLAVVSMLFVGTSSVQPMEGPYVAGTINVLRAAGTFASTALVGELLQQRSTFHFDRLLADSHVFATQATDTGLASLLPGQAAVLAYSDIFQIFGWVCLALIPLALCIRYVPAPQLPAPAVQPKTPPLAAAVAG